MSGSTILAARSVISDDAMAAILEASSKAQETGKTYLLSIPLEFEATVQKCHQWLLRHPSTEYMLVEQPALAKVSLHWGMCESLCVAGETRFKEGQDWFDQLQGAMIHEPERPFYVYTTFTFQDHSEPTQQAFPPARYILPEFSCIAQEDTYTYLYNTKITPQTQVKELFQLLHQTLESINQIHPGIAKTPCELELSNGIDPKYYKEIVQKAIDAIKKRIYQKIALARTVKVRKKNNTAFDITQTLENLRNTYPQCTLLHLNNGQGYQYLAATPEHLLTIKDQILFTESIAGSISRGTCDQEDQQLAEELLRCSKNRLEHQWVLDEISQTLEQLGLKPEISATEVIKLTNIQHLKTHIKAKLENTIPPLSLVGALHPTSAVGGLPKHLAKQEIAKLEPFERGLYGGTLGWLDSKGNSEMLVGIRCASIHNNEAMLYAGCGIVETSNPQDELLETEHKIKALALNLA